ncbi:MAG: sigma-70 family RNA polymerase sigma factor [Polyangiaceae bacterium]|nr:sigma-70 family RNA polymerase sigma factor [Polyangiaceae bacterium]
MSSLEARADAATARRIAAPEEEIAAAVREGDSARAVTILVRAYGAEVYGWLVAVHGAVDAADLYGQLSLQLVRAIGGFRGESSARTWLYQIARNEARQHLRDLRRRRAWLTPLEDHPSAAERAQPAASTNSREARIASLRARLREEDRSLLVLRVDRGLAYEDIALVLRPGLDDAGRKREAVRLRRRLCDIRDRLRSWITEDA